MEPKTILEVLEEMYSIAGVTYPPKLLIEYRRQILDIVKAQVPELRFTDIKSLEKFAKCFHINEDTIDSDCIYCNFAWCLERITHLESLIDTIHKNLEGI